MNDNDYLPLGDDGEFGADMDVPRKTDQPEQKEKSPNQTWNQLTENERIVVVLVVYIFLMLLVIANVDKLSDSGQQTRDNNGLDCCPSTHPYTGRIGWTNGGITWYESWSDCYSSSRRK